MQNKEGFVEQNLDMQMQNQMAAAQGIGTGLVIFYLVVLVFFAICGWKLFTKAGQPGWAVLIPIYNAIVFLKIIGRPAWWLVLFLIPFINWIFMIIANVDLAKSFGKGVGFAIGLILLGFIFVPILAFGSAKYVGPAAGGAAPTPAPAAA